jgi:hypothetical protein
MRLPGRLSGAPAICLMAALGWSQESSKSPQISIRVPAPALDKGIQANTFMKGPFGGYGNFILPKPGKQQYVFDASVDGIAATSVQAVVYMPGCELSKFQIVMHGENVERQMECRALSRWSLRGQVVRDGPTAAALGERSSSLEVDVAYLANWVNPFFGIMDGPVATFHVATVPLGEDGSFLVQLPNLVLDPAEKSAEERFRGEFMFTLREKKTWNHVGTLRPSEFVRMGGLELRTQYPDLRFVLVP